MRTPDSEFELLVALVLAEMRKASSISRPLKSIARKLLVIAERRGYYESLVAELEAALKDAIVEEPTRLWPVPPWLPKPESTHP